jgi:phospholipase/carboxylesterase
MTYFVFRRLFYCITFFWAVFFFSSVHAQVPEPDSLTYYWHNAYFAEVGAKPALVISSYKKVMEFCETEPLDVREWFKGNSLFGIARAYAMTGDKEETRINLSKALSRHFWNFAVVRSLPIFDSICGKKWVDSLCKVWSDIREKEIPLWHSQPTFVLKPTNLMPNVKYPLLMVLHGGNDCYERLVKRLGALPDSLGIIIAIPAGVHRLSEVSNSWDDDTTPAHAKIAYLIKELSADPAVDTTNISLLGFSQGSQMSYAYGFSHPEQIRSIIAFSGFAQGVVDTAELKNAALHHMKIIAISGPTDSPDFLRSSRELQEKAEQRGISFEMKIEPNLPHGLPLDVTNYCINLWRRLSGSPTEKPVQGSDMHTANSFSK